MLVLIAVFYNDTDKQTIYESQYVIVCNTQCAFHWNNANANCQKCLSSLNYSEIIVTPFWSDILNEFDKWPYDLSKDTHIRFLTYQDFIEYKTPSDCDIILIRHKPQWSFWCFFPIVTICCRLASPSISSEADGGEIWLNLHIAYWFPGISNIFHKTGSKTTKPYDLRLQMIF